MRATSREMSGWALDPQPTLAWNLLEGDAGPRQHTHGLLPGGLG